MSTPPKTTEGQPAPQAADRTNTTPANDDLIQTTEISVNGVAMTVVEARMLHTALGSRKSSPTG